MFFAGLNALYFEFVIAQRVAGAGEPLSTAFECRATRVSLRSGLWTLVVVCGRLIPYLPTWG